MNSGRAKKIAKELYGDLSRRGAKYFRLKTGQIIREELRRKYQAAKILHGTVITTVKRKKTRVPKWYNKAGKNNSTNLINKPCNLG
jgi:hypothetical protein